MEKHGTTQTLPRWSTQARRTIIREVFDSPASTLMGLQSSGGEQPEGSHFWELLGNIWRHLVSKPSFSFILWWSTVVEASGSRTGFKQEELESWWPSRATWTKPNTSRLSRRTSSSQPYVPKPRLQQFLIIWSIISSINSSNILRIRSVPCTDLRVNHVA